MSSSRRALAALSVLAVTVAAQLPAALQPLGGDDVYILENLRSTSWSRRIFAFNLDPPSPSYFPWWEGEVVQRRFIRAPAAALLWLETEIFGYRSLPYHIVTLAIVAGCCALIFTLLARRVAVSTAAIASLVPALHPATSEVVSELACQPLATAALFSWLALKEWIRMRQRRSVGALIGAVLACALAMTSYEAAVVLPIFVILADVALDVRDGSNLWRWGPRGLVAALLLAYLPWALEIRRGLVAPDVTPVRPLHEVFLALRYDSVEYVCKAFGLLDPTNTRAYRFHEWVGEALAVAVAVALVATPPWLIRRSRLGILGVVAWGLFLAPPLLTRATVSALNFPSLRQLFLPMVAGAPLVVAALIDAWPRTRLAFSAWCVGLAVESAIAGGTLDDDRARRAVAATTAKILSSVPPTYTVVAVGDRTCQFAPSLVWSGPSLRGLPGSADDPGPQLTAVDDHTVVARAAIDFDVRAAAELPHREPGANRGPSWLPSTPTELATTGTQRISGATVTIEARDGGRITALRYKFDRPLEEIVFIRFRGCDEPERMRVYPAK